MSDGPLGDKDAVMVGSGVSRERIGTKKGIEGRERMKGKERKEDRRKGTNERKGTERG